MKRTALSMLMRQAVRLGTTVKAIPLDGSDTVLRTLITQVSKAVDRSSLMAVKAPKAEGALPRIQTD
jgi:hypothetical protein